MFYTLKTQVLEKPILESTHLLGMIALLPVSAYPLCVPRFPASVNPGFDLDSIVNGKALGNSATVSGVSTSYCCCGCLSISSTLLFILLFIGIKGTWINDGALSQFGSLSINFWLVLFHHLQLTTGGWIKPMGNVNIIQEATAIINKTFPFWNL